METRKFIPPSLPKHTQTPLPRPPPTEAARPRPLDEKLSSMKAYRRARGLCDRCAEKWSPGHRCSPTVQLHVLEEMWQLLEDNTQSSPVDAETTPTQELLSLSLSSVTDPSRRHTMQLIGECQGHMVIILLDSSSYHSFVSTSLAAKLSGMSLLPTQVLVHVADGGVVPCNQVFKSTQWSVQGHVFVTDFRVFPLQSYDIVLGMDWLEKFSPMKIHWSERWLSFSYQGKQAVLQGNFSSDNKHLLHVVYLLHSAADTHTDTQLDPRIAQVIKQFQSVFESPKGLPPSRSCDHTIPLLPGAQPVFIRPYRYAPVVKDEIERQVSEMLDSGIIRHSTSPFSS
jgi:hypothetical protein